MRTEPVTFIHEPIEAMFIEPPLLPKHPPCPDAFLWRDEHYRVVEQLEMWQDFKFRKKGYTLRHATWGVGRFYFCVRVADGRIFEIYYDRAPKGAGDRDGHWVLVGERREVE